MFKNINNKKYIKIISIIIFFITCLFITYKLLPNNNNKKNYTVTFNTNGGQPISSITQKEGYINLPNEVSKEGYEFCGWIYNDKIIPSPYYLNQNITLNACWNEKEKKQYTIKFELNGGTGQETITSYEGTIELPIPTKKGYKFNGWLKDNEPITEPYYLSENITLVATWTPINTCTPSKPIHNAVGIGMATFCLTQTCENSKWNIKNNNNTSINCAEGYIKKYKITDNTCPQEGSSCNTTTTTTCTQNWHYNCEIIKTIVNVPVDSRPIQRTNFEYLVKAAGYNYNEINNGLDSANGTSNYFSGDYSKVISQTEKTISNNNTKNTTAIINTTSYFFGGLTESRGYEAYTNKQYKIDSLTHLLKTYTKPKYYITFIIPRTIPEDRAINIYKTNGNNYVCGLNCYQNNKNNAYNTTFTQATMEWAYLKSMKKNNNSAYQNTPLYVKNFYQEFEQSFYGTNSSIKENGKSALQLYESVFTNADLYLADLITLKQNSLIDELIIGSDDFQIPNYIIANKNLEWIPKNNNIPIKYGFSYDLYNKYYQKKSSTINFFSTDEINNLILSREIVRNTNKKVNFSYTPTTRMETEIQSYSKETPSQELKNYISFINYYGKSAFSNTMSIEFMDYNISIPSLVERAYNNVDSSNKNTLIIDLRHSTSDDHQYFGSDLLEELTSQKNRSIFEIPAISGWNTSGNKIGIGLSRAVVYTYLEEELNTYMISNEFKERIKNYVKSQMIALLEDSIYNESRTKNNPLSILNTKGKELLESELNSSINIKIGKYKYTINNASFTASQPWNRNFDVLINPTFTSITIN